MKFSISNIAWLKENDEHIYGLLKELGFNGIEIAPTRIFESGYNTSHSDLMLFRNQLKKFNLEISSMQSLLFGYVQGIFESSKQNEAIQEVMAEAFKFAETLGISNLVFGSPSLRNINNVAQEREAKLFFDACMRLASLTKRHFSIEPNPIIYKTNFITTTQSAFDYVSKFNHAYFGVNLDLGTILENNEDIDELLSPTTIKYVNHVHISEPFLVPISNEHKQVHFKLLRKLKELNYQHYVSIEMKRLDDVKEIERILRYIRDIALEVGVFNGN